ncbi:MAG: EboA domain-containing protein [Methylococcales bacterium]|nr:EboA domain-containing protein [Methylococcales bacterium]
MINDRLKNEEYEWFDQAINLLSKQPTEAEFYQTMSLTGRKISHQLLSLTTQEQDLIHQTIDDWLPVNWFIDQVVRLCFLNCLSSSEKRHNTWVETLWATADSKELISFNQGLILFENADVWLAKLQLACRSNVTDIFSSVALNNAYPFYYFPDQSWNQMVLKTIHLGLPLEQIFGLKKRLNEELTRMIDDYMDERKSANRSIPDGVAGLNIS